MYGCIFDFMKFFVEVVSQTNNNEKIFLTKNFHPTVVHFVLVDGVIEHAFVVFPSCVWQVHCL